MGMYTEFHFNAELKKDTPMEVINDIHAAMDCAERDWRASDCPLSNEDLSYLFLSDSFYFPSKTISSLRWCEISGRYFINIRSNLKNYNNEIERFLGWILPYVDASEECLGYYRYESYDDPTLIYKNSK